MSGEGVAAFPNRGGGDRNPQGGNALFLILIAVALFAALCYALTHASRGGGSSADEEKAALAAAVSEQCNASVERAANMLEVIGHCTTAQISYELPDGSNDNPAAPLDKSCHVFDRNGAGETPCGAYLAVDCDLTDLLPGEKCAGNDIVYVGTSGGNRIYTTLADQGMATWNKGSGNTLTGATSASDGLTNTNTLVALSDAGSPYNAAVMCRTLGAEWYLPSKNELHLLFTEQNTGVLAGTFDQTGAQWFIDGSLEGYYWSSSEGNSSAAWDQRFDTDVPFNYNKWASLSIRCVRRD